MPEVGWNTVVASKGLYYYENKEVNLETKKVKVEPKGFKFQNIDNFRFIIAQNKLLIPLWSFGLFYIDFSNFLERINST